MMQLKAATSKQLTADGSINSHYRKGVWKNWKFCNVLLYGPTHAIPERVNIFNVTNGCWHIQQQTMMSWIAGLWNHNLNEWIDRLWWFNPGPLGSKNITIPYPGAVLAASWNYDILKLFFSNITIQNWAFSWNIVSLDLQNFFSSF